MPDDENGRQRKGLGWILAANAVLCIDYSLIMPTGFQYVADLGGSSFFYGATIAAFPIGRICLLMPIGNWSDRAGFRLPFLVGNIAGIAGGLCYGSASSLGSKWYAMLGRFLGGCGATAPLSAWAARTYPPEKRVQIESMQKAAQLVGVIIGPSLNALFINVDYHNGFLHLNPSTLAGYLPAMMSAVLLIGLLFRVVEPPPISTALVTMSPVHILRRTGAWACLFLGFNLNLFISAMDTIVSPLNSRLLGWTLLENSMVFAALAIVSVVGAVVGIIAGKYEVKPIRILMAGSSINLIAVGFMATALWNAPSTVLIPMLYSAVAVGVVCMLAMAGPAGGLYQQACGNSQGVLGAAYSISFALGRPAGSLLGGYLLNNNAVPLCISLVVGSCLALGFQFLVRHRIQNAEDEAMNSIAENKEGMITNDSFPTSPGSGDTSSGSFVAH